jgi:methylase of polypeptide subunit release factors
MNNIPILTHDLLSDYSPNRVFFCPEESQFYSQCIEKMILSQSTIDDSIVEFGTGDGGPVIRSLLNTGFSGLIQGYELNLPACEQARSRIQRYGLADRYVIHPHCFFENADRSANYLIANPPYLPAPDSDLYMPSLHGGVDGAGITNRLLEMEYENVLLMVSSYSNPVYTIEHSLRQGYKVVDFTVSSMPFGYYSCEPKVKETIAALRHDARAFYSERIYILAGVLFKRNSYDRDISSDLLKIMTAL